MFIELGFDDIPSDYLKILSDKKKELRKAFGNAQLFLTPRRIILKFDSKYFDHKKILEFIRCQFKEMKWVGGNSYSFVRPLRWILSFDGDKAVDFELFGVKSSNFTFSHRAIGNKKVYVNSEEDYFIKIANDCKVELSHIRRREKIENFLKSLDINPEDYKKLLDMSVFTTEFPDYVHVDIEMDEVPPKIVEKVLVDFVFVFPIKSEATILGNKIKGFVAIIDNPDPDKEKIKEGYLFVVKSRLEDAEFYIKEDKKIPFSQRIHLLSDILYNEKFGSYYDRAVFVSKIADFISAKTSLGTRSDLRRTVMFSKADITTGLFREFPEHQGYIGMFYLIQEGEDEKIAQAVYEHKLPEKQDDEIPKTELGKVVSLADKLAHVLLAFLTDLPITSEEDPFGIRRAARSALRIMVEGEIDINLVELADFITPLMKDHFEQKGINVDVEQKIGEAIAFILERTEFFLSESFPKDITRAVLSRTVSPYDAYQRVKALVENDFYPAFYVARRVKNILDQAQSRGFLEQAKQANITNDIERAVFILSEELKNSNFVAQKKYTDFLKFFESAREKIDIFFNSLIVLSDNVEERNTRLFILLKLFESIDSFADFSMIEKPQRR